MESKPPLSARRTAAELTAWRLAQNGQLLYNAMRHEYEFQQRRWRPPWDSLPEATKSLWIDVARKFLARARTPSAKNKTMLAALKAIRDATNSDQEGEAAACKASTLAVDALAKIGED